MHIENFKQGNNNALLFCGHLYNQPQSEYVASMVLGKINSASKLIWGKYFYKEPIAENCIIQDFEETSTAIYWAGIFRGSNNKPFIVKTDQSGNIIWSFTYNINYGSGTPYSQIKKIKYVDDNEIYTVSVVAASPPFSAYSLITRLKSDGTIVWSKAFKTGNAFDTYFGSCSDIYKKNNELIVLGDYFKSNYFDNPNNKAGFIKMNLDPNDGTLIQLKSFYIPLLREFDYTTYDPINFKLDETFNGYAISTVVNGAAALSTYKNKAIKIKVNQNFNINNITQITPIGNNSNDWVTDISTNNNNESCVTINKDYDYYFTFLNTDDSLIKVRKLRSAFKRPSQIDRGLIFDNDGSITQLTKYLVSANDRYELIKLSGNWPNSSTSCMGIDTSYVKVENIGFSNSDFAWEGTETDIVQTQAMTLAAFDITMQDELICKEEQVCNSISLTVPDTVCDLSQPVVITAHKNQSCLKKIGFTFDTTAISSFSQPNDTTLLLQFNKGWSGKVYANLESCSSLVDSVQITVLAPSSPIDLGNDTVYCPGHTYLLNAQKGFKQYLWQDGSTDSMFTATKPGKYYVTATDQCNRIYTDTLTIKDFTYSLSAGNDTTICESEKIQLNVTAGFVNYNWTPVYKIINPSSRTPIVFPDITTTYYVSAEKFPGCTLTDTIKVSTEKCPDQFFIPNAFTPNKDGKNDLFKPIITGSIAEYEFKIFNRWGQLVFKSTDKNNGWDGALKGLNQDGNIFVWICKYRFTGGELQTKKGTVLLIR